MNPDVDPSVSKIYKGAGESRFSTVVEADFFVSVSQGNIFTATMKGWCSHTVLFKRSSSIYSISNLKFTERGEITSRVIT